MIYQAIRFVYSMFQALLLDSDEIAGHLKSKHEITHKDYNSRFMSLIKEDKEKEGSKVVKSKPKTAAKKCVKESSGPLLEKTNVEIPDHDVHTDKSSSSFTINDPASDCVASVEKCVFKYEDFKAGPSSGQRLTERQRDENLENLFRLQRILLRKRCDEDDDEDDDLDFSTRSE